VAVVPAIVVHAHYIKEDMTLAPWCTASIFFFLKFAKDSHKRYLIGLGICTGLAFSSKYVAILLVPLYLLSPLVCGLPDKKILYKRIGIVFAIASIVFFLINYPILFRMGDFKQNVLYEANHVVEGHHLMLSPFYTFLSFHFIRSILPGMTWSLAIPSLLFSIFALVKWKETRWEEKFLLLYVIIFYLGVELSPMKAFPDYMRYVIPVLPVLSYFSFRAITQLSMLLFKKEKPAFISVLFCLCLVYPTYDTVNLVHNMNRDTRARLAKWLKGKNKRKIAEHYTVKRKQCESLGRYYKKSISKKTKYLVSSSFVYDRYFYGAQFKGQNKEVYRKNKFYKELLMHSSKRFKPAHKSFAFSNPTIHIIKVSDLEKSGALKHKDIQISFKKNKTKR